jgi:hypothetical protein
MRVLAGLALVLASVAQEADAAMWVRISIDPSQPIAGAPAQISVLTFALDRPGCVDDPARSAIPVKRWYGSDQDRLPELRLTATAPSGHEISVRLSRERADDDTMWSSAITFTEPGTWRLSMTYPGWQGPADTARCAGFLRDVDVAAGRGESDYAAPIAAIAAAILAGAALLVRRRRQATAE